MFVRRCTAILLGIFLAVLAAEVQAQTGDSVRMVFSRKEPDRPLRKFKIFFNFDSRNSFMANELIQIMGMRIGAEIRERHRFGFGVYRLSNRTPVSIPVRVPAIEGQPAHETDASLDFRYAGVFYEYVFFENYNWEWAAGMNYGVGTSDISFLTPEGRLRVRNGNFALLEPTIGTTYTFSRVRWLGLGAGLGYRHLVAKDSNVRLQTDAPIYILKVKIFLGEAIRSAFKKKNTSKT